MIANRKISFKDNTQFNFSPVKISRRNTLYGMKPPIFPESTPDCLIITSKHYIFNKKAYNEDLLGKLLTRNDFEILIDEINRVMSYTWSDKKKAMSLGVPCFTKTVVVLSILLTALYMGLLYHSTTNPESVSYAISIVIMTVVIILAMLLSLTTFCTKVKKFQTLDDMMKTNLDEYLTSINHYFQGYLEWQFIPNQSYLEVKIINNAEGGDNSNNNNFSINKNNNINEFIDNLPSDRKILINNEVIHEENENNTHSNQSKEEILKSKILSSSKFNSDNKNSNNTSDNNNNINNLKNYKKFKILSKYSKSISYNPIRKEDDD
jgi:hypothetical protein